MRWIGDKKPVQQCDPQLMPFLIEHFPDARLIHIVRHPWAVTASMESAAENWDKGVPDYWKEGSEVILDRWAIHEQWALQATASGHFDVHRLRLEDLARDPHTEMDAIFRFLELSSANADTSGYAEINEDPNSAYRSTQYTDLPEVAELMKEYGYSPTEI